MSLIPLIWWTFFEFFTLKIKKKILNGHWNVPAIQQHSVGLNVHWKVTEQCLKSGFQWKFREQSVDIQKCFSWLKGEFSSCEWLLLLIFKSFLKEFKKIISKSVSIFLHLCQTSCKFLTIKGGFSTGTAGARPHVWKFF